MSVEQVSAEELAGLDLDVDDGSLQLDAAVAEVPELLVEAGAEGEAAEGEEDLGADQ